MIRPSDFFRPWRRWYEGAEVTSTTLTVRARDGVRLQMHRVPPAGSGCGPAVLLLHGLSANRCGYLFPERALAPWLAERGFDCYVPELRGHGQSESPATGWDLDDYLQQDLPAIIDTILQVSGQSELHWVGHSLGGILLFCYGIQHPDSPICSGVTLGSALDYSVGRSDFSKLLRFRPIVERVDRIPFGQFTHWLAPLLARRAEDSLTRFNVWPSNIEPVMTRRIFARAFHAIPSALLLSLAHTFEPEGLRSRDGRLSFLAEASRFEIPVLLVAGSEDAQVSVEAVRYTATLLGGPTTVRVFGRAAGERDEYGHWDLLLGERAPAEVWPRLHHWLAEHSCAGDVRPTVCSAARQRCPTESGHP